jgi:hypothetical protein
VAKASRFGSHRETNQKFKGLARTPFFMSSGGHSNPQSNFGA